MTKRLRKRRAKKRNFRTTISNRQEQEWISKEIHDSQKSTVRRAGTPEAQVQRKKIRANGGCLGYPEARKVVVSCEKVRGSANRN